MTDEEITKAVAKYKESNITYDVSDIKIKINNLLWMHCRPDVTLGEADAVACEILTLLEKVVRIKEY